jgi:hypothetical protein
MEDEPAVIRQEMKDSRTALAEKLETLENRVMNVASSVSDTVENVTEGVQETVESVKESVQETIATVQSTFDLRGQFDRHPLAMTGGCVGVGYLLGLLTAPRSRRRPAHQAERAEQSAENRADESAHAAIPEFLEKPLLKIRDMAMESLVNVARGIFQPGQ